MRKETMYWPNCNIAVDGVSSTSGHVVAPLTGEVGIPGKTNIIVNEEFL
jgi:hypothetical protein